MRSLIRVTALASLFASCSAGLECPEIQRQPVIVELINAETDRRISGATVTVSDGNTSIELMEVVRGRYGLWNDVLGDTVTATHADYFDATAALVSISSECSFQQIASIRMERKTPCNHGIAGVRVDMRDEVDGSPIAGATVDLLDGVYSERMREMSAGLYEGAYDRPGIYQVAAQAPGYRTATAESIWVEEDDCSVLTSAVDLTLQRSTR